MKIRKLSLVAISLAFLLSICLFPVPVSADPVWEDNFNDKNLDGWTVLNGTWDASNGYLEATGTQSPETNTIVHPCSQGYGIFDFDVYKTAAVAGWYWYIPCGKNLGAMALDLGLVTYDGIGVRIESDSIDVCRVVGNGVTELDTYVHDSEFDGWLSLSLAVLSNHSVKLWFEGELVVETVSLTSHTGIEYSYSMAPAGGAFDNIVVNPEPEDTSTTTDDTETTTSNNGGAGDPAPIPLELLAIGIAVPVVLVIAVVVVKMRSG